MGWDGIWPTQWHAMPYHSSPLSRPILSLHRRQQARIGIWSQRKSVSHMNKMQPQTFWITGFVGEDNGKRSDEGIHATGCLASQNAPRAMHLHGSPPVLNFRPPFHLCGPEARVRVHRQTCVCLVSPWDCNGRAFHTPTDSHDSCACLVCACPLMRVWRRLKT